MVRLGHMLCFTPLRPWQIHYFGPVSSNGAVDVPLLTYIWSSIGRGFFFNINRWYISSYHSPRVVDCHNGQLCDQALALFVYIHHYLRDERRVKSYVLGSLRAFAFTSDTIFKYLVSSSILY